MIYELKPGAPDVPADSTRANDAGGAAIPWSALSGLIAIPGEAGKLQAVWDWLLRPEQ